MNFMPTSCNEWMKEAARTGELFPGRLEVRPSPRFGPSARSENVRTCLKNYRTSNSNSPGIVSVQCVRRHPRLIGLFIMLECEGITTSLSVFLFRFRVLPRVTYYDNACNMLKSIVQRAPWVNDDTLIVCDRFHDKSQGCSSVCDPDSYKSCLDHGSSSVESINHLWSLSKSHLRYLHSDNLMPFLTARAVFLNVRARCGEHVKKMDVDKKQYR